MSCKLLCFGDSNTFGYDPRGFLGEPYERESRWVDILRDRTGWVLVNAGQNGREIPRHGFELEAVTGLLGRHRPDLTLVMLGTNDLLQGADAETVTARMEAFLGQLPGRVFLIAPPPLQRGVWVPDDRLLENSRLLGPAYGQLAARLGIPFADSGSWGIELTFDGVHFSEAGHRNFARQLLPALEQEVAHGTLCDH